MNVKDEQEDNTMMQKRKFPWFAEQTWIHTLFLHWPVTPETLKSYIPAPLEVDTYNGSAWITIAAFHAENSKLRLSPKWTSLDPVTQINVRTYVTAPGSDEKGVYFFSLYVKHLTASLGAQSLFNLPFTYARTSMQEKPDETITVRAENAGKMLFSATYHPNVQERKDSSLGTYLAERYCIWNMKGNQLIKIPIKHESWDLFEVDATVDMNHLLPIETGAVKPEMYYSPLKKAVIYPYENFLKTGE